MKKDSHKKKDKHTKIVNNSFLLLNSAITEVTIPLKTCRLASDGEAHHYIQKLTNTNSQYFACIRTFTDLKISDAMLYS